MKEIITDITFRVLEGGFIDGHPARMWSDSGPHADPFSRLYYIDGGEGRLEYAGRTFALKPGWLYMFPSHYPIFHRPSPGLVHYYVHFTAHVPGALSLFDVTEWGCEKAVTDRKRMREAMLRMMLVPESPSDVLRRQVDLQGVVAEFLEGFTDDVSSGTRRFTAVVEYIHEHLAEKIPLSALAGISSLHPNYFSNLFTGALGVSPREYIMTKRIERAQLLLWRTDMRVSEVADAVGCEESAYFCRVFKKRTGMTPRMYRSQRVRQ